MYLSLSTNTTQTIWRLVETMRLLLLISEVKPRQARQIRWELQGLQLWSHSLQLEVHVHICNCLSHSVTYYPQVMSSTLLIWAELFHLPGLAWSIFLTLSLALNYHNNKVSTGKKSSAPRRLQLTLNCELQFRRSPLTTLPLYKTLLEIGTKA